MTYILGTLWCQYDLEFLWWGWCKLVVYNSIDTSGTALAIVYESGYCSTGIANRTHSSGREWRNESSQARNLREGRIKNMPWFYLRAMQILLTDVGTTVNTPVIDSAVLDKTHFKGVRFNGDDNGGSLYGTATTRITYTREDLPRSQVPMSQIRETLCSQYRSKDYLALTNACDSMTSMEKEEMKECKYTFLFWQNDKLNLRSGKIRAAKMENLQTNKCVGEFLLECCCCCVYNPQYKKEHSIKTVMPQCSSRADARQQILNRLHLHFFPHQPSTIPLTSETAQRSPEGI